MALGDAEPNLLQILTHYLDHQGLGIGRGEELEALVRYEPVNTGELTKMAIHSAKQCSICPNPCQTGLPLTGYCYRDIKLRGIAERGGEINEAPDMSRAPAKSVALNGEQKKQERRAF